MIPDKFQNLHAIENELRKIYGVFPIESIDDTNGLLEKLISDDDIQELQKDLKLKKEWVFIPPLILETMTQLLQRQPINLIADPCANLGALISILEYYLKPKIAFGCSPKLSDTSIGNVWAKNVRIDCSDPLVWIESLDFELDAVVSIITLQAKQPKEIKIKSPDGEVIVISGGLLNQTLMFSSTKLSMDGIGIFLVPTNYFSHSRYTYSQFNKLGIGIEAAFELPPTLFPNNNTKLYLIVIRKKIIDKMFVARLSNDIEINQKVLSNYFEKSEDDEIEQGRIIESSSFRGFDEFLFSEKIKQEEKRFGLPPVRLSEIALEIIMGRSGKDFCFSETANAIYIPTIGNRDVLSSINELEMKPLNYAQVVIDPSKSMANFVKNFLNSSFGKEIREKPRQVMFMLGNKLYEKSLGEFLIFVPDLANQKTIIDTETNITKERNRLQSFLNELDTLHKNLLDKPLHFYDVNLNLAIFSQKISGGLKSYSPDDFSQWIEILPFPLASILREWQRTHSGDYKTKVEHLLHFFEATAEFLSIIFLSAYSSNENEYLKHKERLIHGLVKGKLSFERASFGAWKVVIEYFSKQTSNLFNGNPEYRNFCFDIFSCNSPFLPQMLTNEKLIGIVTHTNKMRNDWGGHGGMVSQEESKLRHEQLLGELQNLKSVMNVVWEEVLLVKSNVCQPKKGGTENEISVLMGSNSQFLSQKIITSEPLFTDSLYIFNKGHTRGLKLLPLITFGASPNPAKNTCYFYNRLEKDKIRYISYHFSDESEFHTTMTTDSEINKILFIKK